MPCFPICFPICFASYRDDENCKDNITAWHKKDNFA
jgi:hypothetical protein